MEEEMTRIRKFEIADFYAERKGYEKSPTGMYRVEDSEQIEPPMNICAICLFIEDEPYNYGDIITPTSYDGDCDDCCGESRLYSTGENDPKILAITEQSPLELMYTPSEMTEDDESPQ